MKKRVSLHINQVKKRGKNQASLSIKKETPDLLYVLPFRRVWSLLSCSYNHTENLSIFSVFDIGKSYNIVIAIRSNKFYLMVVQNFRT